MGRNKKLAKIENAMEQIQEDTEFEVRPEFLKKVERIRAGVFHRYNSPEELRKAIEKRKCDIPRKVEK